MAQKNGNDISLWWRYSTSIKTLSFTTNTQFDIMAQKNVFVEVEANATKVYIIMHEDEMAKVSRERYQIEIQGPRYMWMIVSVF